MESGDSGAGPPFSGNLGNIPTWKIDYMQYVWAKTDTDSLPQLPFWGPLFGYSRQWWRTTTYDGAVRASTIVGRPLNAAETDAWLYYSAKASVTSTYTAPITLLMTYFAWRRGRMSFRFPFYTPKGTWFNPVAFPSVRRPFLQGRNAIMTWQGLRFSAYGLITYWFVSGFVRSYSTSVLLLSIHQDPRLKGFGEELSKKATEARARRAERLGHGPMADSAQRTASEDVSSTRDVYDNEYRGSNETSAPYFGGDGEDAQGPASRNPQVPRGTSEATARDQAYGYSAGQPQAQGEQQDQQSNSTEATGWSDDGELLDDASPIAPQHRQSKAQPSQRSGNTWDKIRNQSRADAYIQQHRQKRAASGGSSQDERQGQSRGSQEDGGYTYSEENKPSDKEQAQKQFDAMLEKEREGDSEERKWR